MSDVTRESGAVCWPTFNAQPFASDGGSSLLGLLILTLVTCVTGAVTGLIGGFIAQWFFLIVLFPLGMGLMVGVVGAWGVKVGKVRMPMICGLAGLLGGCVAVATMHGFEYYRFEAELAQIPPNVRAVARDFEQLNAKRNELDPPTQELLNELAKDPTSRRGLAVDGLLSYVDFKAHQGVELSRARGGRKGLNLGYTGSYCYWGFELLLIAGVAFAVMKGAAEEPFCSRCDQWKRSETLPAFEGNSAAIRDALQNGDLSTIAAQSGAGDKMSAILFTCENCRTESPVEVRLNSITVSEKGEEATNALCTVTYPGEATGPLQQVFAAATQSATLADAASADSAVSAPPADA